MLPSRDRLLQQCTVKLVPANSKDWGTGFLVTPNCILTCAHVVEGHDVIPVWWRGQDWATARVEQILPLPVDLALLQIELPEGDQPPWVLLSETFNPFDRLYVYGYPDDFPDGGSVTIQCEGDAQEQGVTLIKAQAGQVRPGHSGSPALNWETGQVCGVVSDTRSRSTDLGGLLIPVATVFSHFPNIQVQNRAAHSRDSLWFTLPLQPLAASQPRSPVPPPKFSTYNPATFAGRSAETATLTAYLRGSCRILAIVGMTGIGKTALAERVVANVMDATESATLPYCRFSLDDLSLTPDFASSGAALLRALREEPTLADQQDSANLVEHILQRLNRQPCRLQIDSLEHLLQGNEQEGWSEFCDPLWLDLLQKFLAGTDCPSQLILTSQDIPGDLDVVASRYPQFWHCEPLQGLHPDEQCTLFQNLGLTPSGGDGKLLQRIGAFYDGHPLVLQVIAEEIRQRPFQGNIRQYWHHYGTEFTTIAPTTARKLDRSRLFRRRVRQRVEQTIHRLLEPARQMLCASAVFRRPVPIEFWYAMLSDGDADAAFDLLQNRHLVEYAPSDNDILLIRQHNLIRSVAYTLLKADLPTWAAAERHAAYLWLTAYQPAPNAPNIETVRGYLEAFDHYCEVEDWETARNTLLKPLDFSSKPHIPRQLELWGFYQEGIQVCQKIFSKSSLDTDAICLRMLGNYYLRLGDYLKAIDHCEHSLTIVRKIEDWQGESAVLGSLGLAYHGLGNYEQAIDYYQQSLKIAREIDYRQGESNTLGNLGNAYNSLGNYEQAISLHQQALVISREIGDRYGEGQDLIHLGRTYYSLGDYERAIDYHQQSLSIAWETGDRRGIGNALSSLGLTYTSLGNYERASDFYQQSLSIAREIGDRRGEGTVLVNMGIAQLKLKQYSGALTNNQTALKIFRRIGDRANEAKVLKNFAELHRALGEVGVARQYCQQALTLATGLGIPLKDECEALLQQFETSGRDNDI